MRFAAAAILAATFLASCGPSAARAPAFAVRDSAGITIVENGPPALAPAWQVRDTPTVSVGGRPDEPGHDLLRVTAARRLPDGSLLVADGGSAQLRLFDAAGGFVRAVGREGSGPGEFRQFVGILPGAQDSIVTIDGMQRHAVFGPDLGFVREFRLQSPEARVFAAPWGRNGAGELIGLGYSVDTTRSPGERYRGSMRFMRFRPDGSFAAEFLTLPGAERYRADWSEGGRSFPAEFPVEFGRQTVFAVQADRMYAGLDEAFELLEYGYDGALRRIVRVDEVPTPVTAADREAQIERSLEPIRNWRQGSEEMKTRYEERIRNAPFADRMPFYGAIEVAVDGTIWVQRYQRPAERFREYVVLDSSGALLATAQLPDRVRPLQIGPDWLVGRWTDEDDVEYVRVYPIQR